MGDNQQKDQPGSGDQQIGEGNREADRQYREDTKRYVESGRPEEAGKEAQRAVDDPEERKQMEDAERIGRQRAGEHYPEVVRKKY